MMRVVLGTKQTLLFSGWKHEKEQASGTILKRSLRENFCDSQNGGVTRRVVISTVIDPIALVIWLADPEMVPVGTEDDKLALLFRVSAVEHSYHVRRIKGFHFAVNIKLYAKPGVHGFEIPTFCLILQSLDPEFCCSQNLCCRVVSYPRFELQEGRLVLWCPCDFVAPISVGRSHDVPTVT